MIGLHLQPSYEELRAAREAMKVPPVERFQRMIRRGLINSEGRLTRLFGGEAEPESPENGGPPSENCDAEE